MRGQGWGRMEALGIGADSCAGLGGEIWRVPAPLPCSTGNPTGQQGKAGAPWSLCWEPPTPKSVSCTLLLSKPCLFTLPIQTQGQGQGQLQRNRLWCPLLVTATFADPHSPVYTWHFLLWRHRPAVVNCFVLWAPLYTYELLGTPKSFYLHRF